MKQNFFFILTSLFLLSATMVSCSDDDDNVADVVGKWNLVNRSGGLSGTSIDIETGDIVVTFTSNGEMMVSDKTDEHYFITSGTYNYYFTDIAKSIITQKPANVMAIKSKDGGLPDYYSCILRDNELQLLEEAYDGFNYVFKKVK